MSFAVFGKPWTSQSCKASFHVCIEKLQLFDGDRQITRLAFLVMYPRNPVDSHAERPAMWSCGKLVLTCS